MAVCSANWTMLLEPDFSPSKPMMKPAIGQPAFVSTDSLRKCGCFGISSSAASFLHLGFNAQNTASKLHSTISSINSGSWARSIEASVLNRNGYLCSACHTFSSFSNSNVPLVADEVVIHHENTASPTRKDNPTLPTAGLGLFEACDRENNNVAELALRATARTVLTWNHSNQFQ